MGDRRIIKSLEISDFRGLQGWRTLDFEGADIILLLGLNGFGKTSVFDSIEWCLTGKIGRYEQYNEIGRKQDFGKEKQVLRNKYPTNPNTFAKVTLEIGTSFGRRILSDNNESDYNMGSIIEGCEFGLDSIANEVIKPGLANSYFSATHILSQETINHFVTSKKPEERYQALSVNFGTAIFTPFEKNAQTLLGKITDLDKDIKQQIKSKSDLIASLKSQMGSRTKDISISIKEANSVIDTINNLSAQDLYKQLTLKNDIVTISPNFEELVSNTRSYTNLDRSDTKEKIVELHFLNDNIDIWKNDNKELNIVETSISSDKKSIVELDVIQKSISGIKNETSSLKEKLRRIDAQKSNIRNVITELPHYIKSSQKISEIESAIQMRNEALSIAKVKHPVLEETLELKKKEAERLSTKLKDVQVAFTEFTHHKKFFSNYQSDYDVTIEKIIIAEN